MSRWYTTQTERKATLTDFSLASRCYYNSAHDASWYYARSTGSVTANVIYIHSSGEIGTHNPADSHLGLRPAFALREAAS